MTYEPNRPNPPTGPRVLNGAGEPDPVSPRHPGTPAGPAGPADPTLVSPAVDGSRPEIVNPTEARQGSPAGRVRWVLIVGLVCVVIAFALAYMATRP
jgi:hypothetical protein